MFLETYVQIRNMALYGHTQLRPSPLLVNLWLATSRSPGLWRRGASLELLHLFDTFFMPQPF